MTMLFDSVAEWQTFRKSEFFKNKSIGYVATMGNLHQGHKSLLDRSIRENNITLLSIFVNPTQFTDQGDLEKYPRTLEQDAAMAKNCGVDFIIFPPYEELYPDNYRYRVSERSLSEELCGKHRLGHFDGVLTVILKWFQLLKPQRSYWGEKDFQQLLLIKGLVDAFFLDIEVIACPTIRNENGLALSSRNNLLTPVQYELSQQFNLLLRSSHSVAMTIKKLTVLGFDIDYIEEHYGRRFGAVKLGNVRLIDNVKL